MDFRATPVHPGYLQLALSPTMAYTKQAHCFCTGPQLLGNSQSIQPLNWHELCVLRQEPCS